MIDDMEEIWTLYADDGAQALDAAEAALTQIAENDGPSRQEGIASLFRAVHTFKGNARVLGLQVAESRAHLTEDLIGLVRDHGAPWDDEIEAILMLAVDRLRVILETTAATRADVPPEVASDLMEKLRDKIARIEAGGAADAGVETADPDMPAGADADADPGSVLVQAELLSTDDPLPMMTDSPAEELPAAPVVDSARDQKLADRASKLHGILAALGPLAEAAADEARRREIFIQIFDLAEELGYHRLADVSIQLSRLDRVEDVRLYEELYAIQLSLEDDELPSPSPADLLAGWCAVNAFSLIDQLRIEIVAFRDENGSGAVARRMEPLLRRLNFACAYYGMSKAALLSMSLLDLVMRTSISDDRDPLDADSTVISMLDTFVATLELALDAAREGELPDKGPIEELSTQSARFDFVRRGAITADEALDRLHLPSQFLRVMSPRSVQAAQAASTSGMRFKVVRTDFRDETDMAERFFAVLADGTIRQITSVSVLSGNIARFDFLLATSLSDDGFDKAIRSIDPTGQSIQLIEGEIASVVTAQSRSEDGAGVSVEMMEMLGEVSSGLASVLKNLRLASETEARSALVRALGATQELESIMAGEALTGFDLVMRRVEDALQTMDHLSRRVVTLQEEAMASRQRPADHVLRPMIDQFKRESATNGSGPRISASIGHVMLDRQTLEAIELASDLYVHSRLSGKASANGKMDIALKQRDDRVILTIQDDFDAPLPADLTEQVQGLIASAGGRVWVQAEEGTGQRLAINLPTRMLAMEAMVVVSGGVHYVLPVDALLMVVKADAGRVIKRAAAGQSRYLRLDDGDVLPVVTLEGGQADGGGTFLIVQAEGRRKAVLVDSLQGQQVVRLRPLEGVLSRVERLSGLAVLSGGEVALALSPLSICMDEDIESAAFAAALHVNKSKSLS